MNWFQKSRELRLLEGDRNMRYLYLSMIVTTRFDSTEFLKMKNNWVEETDRVIGEIVSFYEGLFTSKRTSFPKNLDGSLFHQGIMTTFVLYLLLRK